MKWITTMIFIRRANLSAGVLLAVFSFLFQLGIARADSTIGEGLPQIRGIVCNILNWLYTFSLIIGVIMILIAAFQYITSNGNTEKVDNATKSILFAIVGIAIAILAKGVPFIVGSVLSVGSDKISVCNSS